MRNDALIRRARIGAGAILVTAALVGAPAAEIVPRIHDVRDALRYLAFSLVFGLGAAAGAILGAVEGIPETTTRRTLGVSGVLAAFGALLTLPQLSAANAFVMLIVGGWGAAMAIPTLPVVRALVNVRARPSHDARDRALAMAWGFLAAVKLPEAAGAWLLDEPVAALHCATLGAVGLCGFAVVQRRRRVRAARVRRWLGGKAGVMLDLEDTPSDVAALLSGEPRLVATPAREAAGYRDHARPPLAGEVIPGEPEWPSVRGDLFSLAKATFAAICLALFAAGVCHLGRMV